MTRFVLAVAASTLALVLILGGLGLVAAQTIIRPRIAEAAAMGPFGGYAPAELQGLHDLPPAERFGHFLGAQLRFADANNAAHNLVVSPGTVSNVSSDKLTITTNDGQSKSFNLTSETRVHSANFRWGDLQPGQVAPKIGDKVVVVTLDSSSDARAIRIGGLEGFQ